MLVGCKVCRREYVASKKSDGDNFVCSRCQGKNKPGYASGLGLHPALERKWAHNPQEARGELPHNLTQGYNGTSNRHASLSDSSSLPKIPGFDISYQIGRGAMGSVYRARQIKTGQLVAIKVLSYDLAERADLVARFEREAYALKSLKNANVVSIIDAGHVGDIHYFAMEFIDGLTLRTRINRGAIGLKEACFITSQILHGLDAAHKHGIIHRDLKPENVLLAYDGRDFSQMPMRVVLADFGLVGIGGLAFDPHPNLTRSKVTMGTVNYMAPEQHVDAKRVDHRSDLYSAGVIFFEMLTTELPLGRYLLPSERGMDFPNELDQLFSKALSRSLETRYRSAKDFLLDLQNIEQKGSLALMDLGPDKLHRHDDVHKILPWRASKVRYFLLLLIAGLFFVVGIKFSKTGKERRVQQVENFIKNK